MKAAKAPATLKAPWAAAGPEEAGGQASSQPLLLQESGGCVLACGHPVLGGSKGGCAAPHTPTAFPGGDLPLTERCWLEGGSIRKTACKRISTKVEGSVYVTLPMDPAWQRKGSLTHLRAHVHAHTHTQSPVVLCPASTQEEQKEK